MTIIEAIQLVDDHKHNTYSQPDKIRWLSTLDGLVKSSLIDTHEGGDDIRFDGYTETTPPDTVLLVGAPHDQIYLRWLEAQIDYANGEYGKYNNAIELFNTEWSALRNHYNRTHMPIGRKMVFF